MSRTTREQGARAPGPRAVYFDLDGTLYDRDALVTRLVTAQCEAFRPELAAVDHAWFIERVLALDEHGYRDKADVYRTVVDELGLDASLADRLERHFWETYDRHCELSVDTRETLETLRRHGLKLGVITNGGVHRQESRLRALGIDRFFDVVLISEREQVKKRDPEIFRRALVRCGVGAAEAIFVGDHPEMDVRGARAAGLTAIWKRVPYWHMNVEGVPSVDRLSDILPYCLPPKVSSV